MQSSWERDDRLGAFVQAAREVVGFDRVNVFLLTADGAELELVTTGGDEVAPGLRLPLTSEAGPYHEALKSRRPVAVLSDADLARVWPLDRARLDHAYLRSRRFVVAPLIVGERVIGVVSADNKPSRRPISLQSVEPFSSLCQNLATALEESRLYAEARAREQEATRLYAVTRQLATSLDRERLLDVIAEQAIELTGCDAVGIFFYDVTRGALVFHRGLHLPAELTRDLALRPGEGIAGRAYQERQPVWTRDRLTDPTLQHSPATQRLVNAAAPRAYLAVPIISREVTYGVLVVYFFVPHDFTAREVQLVSTLADHAALALQNARLFEETQRREREAQTLSDGLVLLNQAARALHRTLEVDAGLYEETQTQRLRLAQIFDSTSDGIVLVSRAGEIQAANRQAGELLGFDASAVIGTRLAELRTGARSVVPDYDRVFGDLAALLEDPDRGGVGDLELRRSGRTVHWTAQPTQDASGETIGFTLTLSDVTHERQVSQMKTDFVSFVTHQLRTPLAGIKWMLELAAQTPQVPAEAGSYVEDARAAAERLIGLVNDLLDVSRLESGNLTVTLQTTNLGKLTQSTLDDLASLVREKGNRVSVTGGEQIPQVM